MGELFTSFEDAWSHFLARRDPLESFFDQFPDDPSYVAHGWLIVPPPEVKREALRVQSALEDVPGLVVLPHHFLHVWLGPEHGPDLDALLEHGPFELEYRGLNCFHTAVVVEIAGLPALDAPETYLPHLTLAVVRNAIDPQPLRDVALPLRDTDLGTGLVTHLDHCSFPCARTTVLEPWTVVERAPLRR